MSRSVCIYLITAFMLSCSYSNHADTLRIPLGTQGSIEHRTLPVRGQSMHSTATTYGEPARKHTAIGQPPITRWDYPEFSVYFEHQHVVYSVRHHAGKQP